MSWFEPAGHRGPGLGERLIGMLFGWMFLMVAVAVAIEMVVALVVPLLPWIGLAVMVGAGVRWWHWRTSRW